MIATLDISCTPECEKLAPSERVLITELVGFGTPEGRDEPVPFKQRYWTDWLRFPFGVFVFDEVYRRLQNQFTLRMEAMFTAQIQEAARRQPVVKQK